MKWLAGRARFSQPNKDQAFKVFSSKRMLITPKAFVNEGDLCAAFVVPKLINLTKFFGEIKDKPLEI